jgi:hypothetical protein
MTEITTGAQTVTAAGPVTGTLDTSTLTQTPALKLEIQNLSAGATARIAIEDTASATAFSDALTVAVWDVAGAITAAADISLSVTADLIPSLRRGTPNTKLRANVLLLTGSSPSLTIHAFTA